MYVETTTYVFAHAAQVGYRVHTSLGLNKGKRKREKDPVWVATSMTSTMRPRPDDECFEKFPAKNKLGINLPTSLFNQIISSK